MVQGFQLTISDLALPTHRATVVAEILAGVPGAGTSGVAPPPGTLWKNEPGGPVAVPISQANPPTV